MSRAARVAGGLALAALVAMSPPAAGAEAAGSAGGAGAGGANEGAGVGYNVVLVTLDTVRADHLGCYGDAAAETPVLDRLARQGVRFAHASSAVPLTLPSHVSILTGLLPLHHGVRNNGAAGLAAGSPTLATRFSAAGYRTGAFVGAFVLDHRFGLQAGFDVYDDEVNRDPNAGWVLEAQRPGSQVVDRAIAWLAHPGAAPATSGTNRGAGGAGKTAAAAGSAGDGARPFFLWVHLYDAHAPYDAPESLRRRHPGHPYDAAVAYDDQQLGRLLAEIDRRGWGPRTVVAVAADHGESLGEHGEQTHGLLLYEAALSVPMLLRAPGVPPGVVATPVGLVDLAPTLVGLSGAPHVLPLPATVGRDGAGGAGGASGAGGAAGGKAAGGREADGRDLSTALRARREPPPLDLYAETRYPEIFGWSPLTALRRRNVKYIAGKTPELYDLDRDPREAVNLAPGAAGSAPAAAKAAGMAARPTPAAKTPSPTGNGAALSTATGTASAPTAGSKFTTAAGAAAEAGEEARLLRGFAGRLAEIEASTAPPSTAAAAAPDAETRARLASLGYIAGPAPRPGAATTAGNSGGGTAGSAGKTGAGAASGSPGSSRAGGVTGAAAAIASSAGGAAGATGSSGAPAAWAGPDSRRQVELFERFQRAHDEQVAGKGEAAIADLRAVVAADPTNPVFRSKLAQALRERGRLADAIPLYRQAADDAPGDPEAWYNLAAALQEAGQLREARTAIEKALRLDPGRPEAHNALGILLLAEEKPEEARRQFAAAVAGDPRNAHAWNNLGNVLRGLGQLDEAADAYRRALAVAPDYPEALNGIGTLEVQRDRPAAALPYFDRALALAPTYQEVRLNRAIALQTAGNTSAAVAAYRDFLRATAAQAGAFTSQRQAAQHFLDQLTHGEAAPVKRPAGGR